MSADEFAVLVKEYERLIYTICYSFTGSNCDAEDLAQETFLSAYAGISGMRTDNVKAWLTAIAANKCRDFLKSPARRACGMDERQLAAVSDPSPTPEQNAVSKNADENVYDMCQTLNEPYRTVATQYFCDGVKLSEMACATGQNIKTLQTRLHRSKKLLRDIWKEREEG